MRLLILMLSGAWLWSGCAANQTPQGGMGQQVPEWAKTAVWYQIFPERFRNGDQTNDPTPADMANSWPYFIPRDWQIHPWTSDWYKLQPWERSIPWHKHFDWAKPGEINFNASAGLRRYGGDLRGVLDKLDYLEELGITAIYFNPLFEAPSLHKYDAAMYHHIDNNFGPNPEKDRQIWQSENPADPATWRWTTADSLFLQLIRECHQRGIKVIIDGVFNHVGNNFWAFKDVVEHQQQSRYKDWFYIEAWDDPTTEENEFRYRGWYGVQDLPELREDDNGLVSGPREHIKAIVQRWMDPNGDGDPSDGIDGWRLDVAEMVNMKFWKEFRQWVKSINPEAYLTGEVWWEDWSRNKMFNAAPWLNSAFDAVMNYRFSRAVKKYVIDVKTQISTHAFIDSLQAIYRDYPRENVLVCQNLMDSHDVDRVASQIVNPDRWYDHEANPAQNPNYDVRKPNAVERQKQKLIVGLQMTLPGAPMIYYGDEAGMWGGDDPDPRKPMVWPEWQYEPEASHPLGKKRPVDTVEFDRDLFDWYRKLIAIRKENTELSLGDVRFIQLTGQPSLLVFLRSLAEETSLVLVNNSHSTVHTEIEIWEYLSKGAQLRNLITNEQLSTEAARLPLTFSPYEVKILKRVGRL